MKSIIFRILGIIVGTLFVVISTLMLIEQSVDIITFWIRIGFGIVFIYYGITSRSIAEDLLEKWRN